MDSKLMYIGVTHETAPVSVRSYLAFTENQKEKLIFLLKKRFPIKAIFILNTCNRAEVYFETHQQTSAYQVRNTIIKFIESIHSIKLSPSYFAVFEHTKATATHLLNVANGLKSAIKGDKQIISQIKSSYQESLKQNNQGSLLERAFQAAFRSHKRIAKESSYKSGSTSTAYSSLKLIQEHFKKEGTKNLKILIIGAGAIAQDILSYLPKFDFNEISISNRTLKKAEILAKNHHLKTCLWQQVIKNDLEQFDVVISAVSNQKNLIKKTASSNKKKLWIDLAIPANISPFIANEQNTVSDIDQITSKIEANNKQQKEAIPFVEGIILQELNTFLIWLEKNEIRKALIK